MSSGSVSLALLVPFLSRSRAKSQIPPEIFRSGIRKLSRKICCNGTDSSSGSTKIEQQQLNLSVLRFTLGIPGLDESYLPRYIGYAFGSLLLLNHFAGSDSSTITAAQLRTEVLGLFLAAFSVVVPYLGRFLKGAVLVNERNVPDGADQTFVMSQNVPDTLKEDLAWGSYVLLRNTNTISVLISTQDALCVRGYWTTPQDVSKADVCNWFEKQIQQLGLLNLKDTLYFPQATDSQLKELLPKGTRSLLVQPLLRSPDPSYKENTPKNEGFVLVASGNSYAYDSKDRAWIRAVAGKFRVDSEGKQQQHAP
ncbi:protein COFACTOR ASSEMBLY OF COMPLEX C SUBUNIT B CCB2, chloroplastic-like isoform X1 [Ipomoea triloba]|uniref:protein COFACTOR ASSEMBLY OF COMPLEX C SUBUNIT B CCB2, chloroplastic-like isoform X1 n=1 Tax=Ipomoea triloba TaxID=35885 RepID=UPI00125DFCDD|nr:protein COFACTOR ASSEMBLY OF COMPLEX C SUBUNIT B CCB2, chloroplastic-like isoform X1 [Ipomoea triloba]